MTAKQFMTKAEFYNVLSLASLAAVPFDSLYSISKAAASPSRNRCALFWPDGA